jgi:hypothetical protein
MSQQVQRGSLGIECREEVMVIGITFELSESEVMRKVAIAAGAVHVDVGNNSGSFVCGNQGMQVHVSNYSTTK